MGKMIKTNQKIPEGWSVKKLGECTLSFSGGTPSVDKTEYYENGKIPFIRSGEIYQDFTELFITKKGLKESSAKMVKKGDLLLALYGANSGDSSVCKIDGAINQAILCIRTKEDNLNFLESLFVIYKDKVIHKYLQGGQGNLSAEIIKSLCFMFPPLCEQEKIAEILGAWDLAIEKLTALIEQKKLLKKGLMQRLLTGKQRLPGFSTPWKKVKLGECLSLLKDGTHGTHQNSPDGIMLLSAKDVINGNILLPSDSRRISQKDFNMLHKNYHLQNDDVALTIVGTIGRCAIIKNYSNNFTFQRSVAVLRPNKTIISKFLYILLQGKKIQNALFNRQSISAQPGIYLHDLSKISFNLPPLPEQKAIADILSKADEEIDLLTRKLDLLQSQKKGLMQQLLTGKIRVKVA